MYIILLGAPGAGKGTQAAVLEQELKLAHVASGDLFREHQQKGTEMGLLAKSYMEKGQLVPDEVTIRMVLERLDRPDCAQGCLLDGFPRTLKQAKALEQALAQRRKAIDKVVYIKVSDEELVRRLSGRWICRSCQTPYNVNTAPPKAAGKCDRCGGDLYQRADDAPETARKRLEVYFQQTTPLIQYYRRAGKLVEVNGEQDIDQVRHDLLRSLRNGAQAGTRQRGSRQKV
ncbi:MAG: adenylate kinase [Chloroflexi bacterium]|nr:adenylate kinase [Chloroflexota bacterium]